jgi:hypothetical protein
MSERANAQRERGLGPHWAPANESWLVRGTNPACPADLEVTPVDTPRSACVTSRSALQGPQVGERA